MLQKIEPLRQTLEGNHPGIRFRIRMRGIKHRAKPVSATQVRGQVKNYGPITATTSQTSQRDARAVIDPTIRRQSAAGHTIRTFDAVQNEVADTTGDHVISQIAVWRCHLVWQSHLRIHELARASRTPDGIDLRVRRLRRGTQNFQRNTI